MCDLDATLDCLIDDIDYHLDRGDFEYVDLFLSRVQVSGQHHQVLLCILCTTLVASDLLRERSSFYHRVEEEIRLTQSEEYTQGLLQRLR